MLRRVSVSVELRCATCKAARKIVKSKETSEVTVGFVPHRPYQGMRPEQSEGVKPLGQSGETQDSMYRTARVNRARCLLILTHRFLKCYKGYVAGVVLGSIILIGAAVLLTSGDPDGIRLAYCFRSADITCLIRGTPLPQRSSTPIYIQSPSLWTCRKWMLRSSKHYPTPTG